MKKIFLTITLMMSFAVAQAADFKTGYAPVNGLKIYYEIHGTSNPNKTPLVLLHGGDPTIGTSFGKVVDEFAKDRQVIAFEQAGHGHTADRKIPFTFEASADDAAALLKFLKIPQADFFGFSNGGSIAMQIGIRHPEITHKLVVASAMTKREGMYPAFWESMEKASLDTMPAEFKEAYQKTAPRPNLQSYFEKSVKRMLDFKDWPDQMVKSIQAPTLILIGDADIIRPEHAVEMFRTLPHANLAILPGVNHMSMVDHWPVQMIENFLDSK